MKNFPIEVRCAWHKQNFGEELIISPGIKPHSDTICKACFEIVMGEIEGNQKRERNAGPTPLRAA
jgi:hypothetical protein